MDSPNRLKTLIRPAHRWVAGKVPSPMRRHYMYLLQTRRLPRFTNPRSFNEKVNWRIINDRRPILVATCDKRVMKAMARERIPDEATLRIPRTLWSGTDIDELTTLPEDGQWVLKPASDSGPVIFGPMPLEQVRRTVADWRDSGCARLGEWGYTQVPPAMILEERIPGEIPTDYKFFCFDGEPRIIQANAGRFAGTPLTLHYDLNYQLRSWLKGLGPGDIPRPSRLEDMLDVARRLSAGMDMLRVDLYCVDDEIWFGEFTPYPTGGLNRFADPTYDLELGSYWTLPRLSPDGTRELDPR